MYDTHTHQYYYFLCKDNATKELKALQKAHTQVLSEKSELQGKMSY